jgi:RimJ/RimL family protein N-acetyltransferase
MRFDPLTLEGRAVRLEPLDAGQWRELWAVAEPDAAELFRWMPYPLASQEDFMRWEAKAFAEQAAGASCVFLTRERATNRVVGTTRYLNIDPAHRRVEIGSTWIATAWQRTALNTEAKFLMLRHGFEVLNCVRIELKTDALNQRSRAAILRLGAQEEGTLRRHMLMPDGRWRDTVYYSILDSEWPGVKAALLAKMR